MTRRKWIGPVAASLLAFGTVTVGSHFEGDAKAANKDWNYYEECWSGCTNEEASEYYFEGSFREEVIREPATVTSTMTIFGIPFTATITNREEVLELTNNSEQWCYELLVQMWYTHKDVKYWTRCRADSPTLGY